MDLIACNPCSSRHLKEMLALVFANKCLWHWQWFVRTAHICLTVVTVINVVHCS